MTSRRCLAIVAAAALCTTSLVPKTLAYSRGGSPAPVLSGGGASVLLADEVHVEKGQVHEGEVVVIFGDVRVEGTVTGQVVVVLGNLDISGAVEGDVVAVLSNSRIAETARIGGELVSVGGKLEGASSRKVGGEIVNVDFLQFVPFSGWFSGWHGWPGGFLWFLFILKLVQLAALFVVLVLITALVPRRLSVIADALPRRWGWALLAGLLAYAGVVLGCIVLAVTIVGIPLAIALGFAMKVTKWLGLASILYLMGHTAGRNLFSRELPHLASVLGGFVAYSLLSLIPLFGSAFGMVMSLLAVGITILTRFGSEEPSGQAGGTGALPGAPPPGVPPTDVLPPVSPAGVSP
jgi:hypothetical protein